MTNYRDFCRHYGLDPTSDDARRQYEEAQANLRALYSVAAKDEATDAINKAKENNR